LLIDDFVTLNTFSTFFLLFNIQSFCFEIVNFGHTMKSRFNKKYLNERSWNGLIHSTVSLRLRSATTASTQRPLLRLAQRTLLRNRTATIASTPLGDCLFCILEGIQFLNKKFSF